MYLCVSWYLVVEWVGVWLYERGMHWTVALFHPQELKNKKRSILSSIFPSNNVESLDTLVALFVMCLVCFGHHLATMYLHGFVSYNLNILVRRRIS